MLNFYVCKICGNMVLKIVDSGNTPVCCGQSMHHLVPASTDGAMEKHVPVVTLENDSNDPKNLTTVQVDVGSTPHPMETFHSIQWIALETDQGLQLKKLNPGDTPHATFRTEANEESIAAYEYCNLHGLWIE